MGKRFIEKEIDGETYIFYMLKPRISLALLTKLFKMIGPGIGKAFPGKIKTKDVLDSEVDIGSLIKELSDRMSYENIIEIVDILFTQVNHKGEGNLLEGFAFDNLFSGRLSHLSKVVFAALGVQYADFLQGKDLLELITEKAMNQNGEKNIKE